RAAEPRPAERDGSPAARGAAAVLPAGARIRARVRNRRRRAAPSAQGTPPSALTRGPAGISTKARCIEARWSDLSHTARARILQPPDRKVVVRPPHARSRSRWQEEVRDGDEW